MNLDDELQKVRDRQNAAMADTAAAGGGINDQLQAAIRAGLDHAVENLDPELRNLELALGVELDGGSFLIAVQTMTMSMQGMNVIQIARERPELGALLREYVEKARAR